MNFKGVTMNKVLSKLLHNKKRMAGLDIGSSSVKIMEIEGDSIENAKLINYAIEPIPAHLSSYEVQLENIEELAEIVRKCWKKSGITTKNMVLALPNSAIISKRTIVPIFDEEEELKLHLENEVIKYLPSGITTNEISLDYSIIGVNNQSPTDYDVLLIAAKKEKIEERVAIVAAAGLVPVIVDVEQYSLQSMLRLMKGDEFNNKTYLLLDASATTLRMMVFRNGDMIASRDTNIGGINLTKDLMSNLNINFTEAEKIKIERSGDETYEIIEKTFLNNYISEFMSAFQYFITSTSVPSIDELILIGGTAGIYKIEDAFKEAILESNEQNIKAEPYIARPLHNLQKNEKINLTKFTQDEPGLFLVTSLALRHLLRPF
jgi:type IV pilus assembly protein PilM